ncbi:MAG: hypothetical protein AAF743_13100, partial [Planctomycetota bacterium]
MSGTSSQEQAGREVMSEECGVMNDGEGSDSASKAHHSSLLTHRSLESPAPDAGSLSQFQLIRRSFVQHKLAMIGLGVLVLFYGVALLAEFVSVAPPGARDVAYVHCPPTPVRFSLEHGLHVRALEPVIDPVSLRRTYVPDEAVVPLTLMAEAEPSRLLGVLPLRHRLIGVDIAELSELPAGVNPVFFPLGADKFGRCMYSRIVHGGRVSLSVGLLGVALTFVLGTLIGGVSGYLGGVADLLIQRTIEIINAVPSLPLWIALAAAMP